MRPGPASSLHLPHPSSNYMPRARHRGTTTHETPALPPWLLCEACGPHLLVCTQGPRPLLGVSLLHVLGWEVSVCTFSAPTCVALCMHIHIHVCWGNVHVCTQRHVVVCPLCGVLGTLGSCLAPALEPSIGKRQGAGFRASVCRGRSGGG